MWAKILQGNKKVLPLHQQYTNRTYPNFNAKEIHQLVKCISVRGALPC